MLLRLDAKKSYERQFFIKLEKPYLKLEKSYFKEPIVGPFGPKTPKRKFLTKNPALSLFKLD